MLLSQHPVNHFKPFFGLFLRLQFIRIIFMITFGNISSFSSLPPSDFNSREWSGKRNNLVYCFGPFLQLPDMFRSLTLSLSLSLTHTDTQAHTGTPWIFIQTDIIHEYSRNIVKIIQKQAELQRNRRATTTEICNELNRQTAKLNIIQQTTTKYTLNTWGQSPPPLNSDMGGASTIKCV